MFDSSEERTVSRRGLLRVAGLTVTAALAGCAGRFSDRLDESTTVSESYDADGLEVLEVRNTNGELTVAGEDRDTVAMEAEKRAGSQEVLQALTIDVRRGDGVLSVTVDDEAAADMAGPTPQVDLELTVPADLQVAQVETVNGVVDVGGVFGPLSIRSINGDVTATGINGDVDVELVNGRIEVDGVDGSVRATVTNGDVTIRSVTGDVTADATNGDVTVTEVDGRVNA